MNAKVEFDGVCKFYGNGGSQIGVLENINLQVKQGEFVVLLGPTGSGKSTLIHLIAGLKKPDQGTVKVDGKIVGEPDQSRVVMFQESALFPWLTVLGNVEFGLKVNDMKPQERRQKALEYLKLVHLGRFLNSYPHELSGGMRQRVALARALVMDPDILLMDEPFAALDAQTRNLLQVELETIWRKTKKTIIFVTHNVREATFLADRVFQISARPGRIKEEYRVEVPRPRHEQNPALLMIQTKIMKSLRDEIEKVQKEELDINYHVSTSGVVTPVSRGMGSNI